jgi:hypothetical protein
MTSTLFRFGVGTAIVAFTAAPMAAQQAMGRGAPVPAVQPQGRGPAPKPATPVPAPAATGKPAHTPPRSIPDHLANQPELVARLQPLLPPGTDLNAASAGFKNLGEFVAAIHVSHNLGLSFDALKAKVTGPNAESLGAAIHDLKPTANAAAEVKTAEKAAKADLAERHGKDSLDGRSTK